MQRIEGAVVLFLWNKEKSGKAHYCNGWEAWRPEPTSFSGGQDH